MKSMSAPSSDVHHAATRRLAAITGVYFRLLRPHQWLKNVLVFLPVLAAHMFTYPKLSAAAISFVSFCLCASGGYVVNDIIDRHRDAAHPKKKTRPLASGALSVPQALIACLVLFVAAFGLALLLPLGFVLILAGYLSFSVAYSILLKRKLVLDVIILAGLYGTRVVAGGAGCEIALSEWLVAFSFFLFLSLALVKRTSELVALPESNEDIVDGRGYFRSDLTSVMILSGASAFVSVLVFALYANSEHVRTLYTRPELLWAISALLVYWLSRTLILAGRGKIDQDPVVFAMTDRASLAAGALAAFFAVVAI